MAKTKKELGEGEEGDTTSQEETPSEKPNNAIAELTQSVGTLLKVIQQEKEERTAQMTEILDNVSSLTNRIDGLQNEIEEVADKGRLDEFEKKTAGKNPKKKIVNLQCYKGKVIVAWSNMITNDVTKNPDTKRIIEDQTTELTYEDGTKEKVEYQLWQSKRTVLKTVLESKKEDLDTGETVFTLVAQDGRKFEVNAKFVN